MMNFKVLSTAVALALALPLAIPSASFAAPPHGGAPHGAMHMGGGRPGGNFHPGGAANFRAGGGGNFRPGGGGAQWSGGGYHHHGNFGPRVAAGVAGAVIGGALASQAYYGGGYYDPGTAYYDNGYYDDGSGAVAVEAAPGGDDSTAYCMQTYRSYDPQSGTYLGYDGLRHPCP
jgi:hypothetical protein